MISSLVTPCSLENLQNLERHLGSDLYLNPRLLLKFTNCTAFSANTPVISGLFLNPDNLLPFQSISEKRKSEISPARRPLLAISRTIA
ncbi:MAG: hypothetical protein K2J36_11360 [Ruminococcus sp.]|nr:hypothetical protein [Ruminococcus sp.]